MSKVLLIYPSYYQVTKCPPVGLLYLAAVLRENGFKDVEILDMGVEKLNLIQLEEVIKSKNPKIVGISFMTPQVKIAKRIAVIAKKVNPSISVVVGGPHATCLPEEMMNLQEIDYVVIGEGEITFLELVRCIFQSASPDMIEGLAYRRNLNGEIVINKRRDIIQNLDKLPFPAWDLVPVKKYSYGAGFSFINTNKPVLAIMASRGCPGQCTFCDSHTLFGRKLRIRSAEIIFAEMKYLYEKFGIEQFDFSDDTLTVHKERLYKLCQLIIESKLPFKWACNSRVNRADKTLFHKMKEAGCIRVDFGVESGDPIVLKRIKKGITVEQALKVHRYAKEAGLQITSFFMVGLPGQDLESVKKSLRLIERLDTDIPNISIATPYPGTELYQEAIKNNWLKIKDWHKYTTSPTYKGYKPTMRTDKMTQEEIIKAYNYSRLYSKLIQFRRRYGKIFYLNPRLYIENFRHVLFKDKKLNLHVILYWARVPLKLIKSQLFGI